MKVIKVLGVVRKVLGKLTDFLVAGRGAGLWNEKPTVGGGKGAPSDPTLPDLKAYR